MGSFLFLGPTGVTHRVTKALANSFDDDHAMVRIDMSEFMESIVSRLIGAAGLCRL